MTMKDSCKITLVQFVDDRDHESVQRRLPGFFEAASEAKSDLIVFPEYVLGRHITLDHDTIQRFSSLAKEHHIYAVGGLIETIGERWATTALLIGRDGELIGKYLKCHPAAGPAPYWWPPIEGHDEEARGILGDGFKTFELDFGTIGIIQCYDGYFPESWGCTSYSGAEIVLWINGRSSNINDASCLYPAHAYACVIGACVTDGANTGFAEPSYGQYLTADGEREEGRLFPRIPERGDGCVHATIDLASLRRLRKHHRMQHQRRPELYGKLTEPVTIWKDYPDIPWAHEGCEQLANKAQL